MSLVTLIRDYVDVANSTEKLDGYTLSSLAYHTIIFLFTVAKQVIVYCFTFHWLRDLTYFCFTPPLILSSFANIGEVGKFIGEPSLHEVHSPLSHLLAFSDWNSSTGVGIIFVGFFNGCFSCMHLSAAHLITIRRMLVQGVPAGLYSALGTAIGQFLFLASIFFGFRGLLFPWLALEPLQFFVGTGIILSVASTMAQDRRTPTIQWSAKSSLFIYLCTNAALAWCEQAAIFQWMGNFSLGAEPTFLETTPSLGFVIDLAKQVNRVGLNSQTDSSFDRLPSATPGEMYPLSETSNLIPKFLSTAFGCAQNLSYLFAFFLGSVVGAFLIAFLLQRFFELVLRYKKIAVYYGLIKQANLPLATMLFAFGFGSMPYYGFDYLVTKGFGFIPQEHFFKQTLFSPINLVSKTSQAKDSPQNRLEDQLALFFTLEGERSKSFAVDTTPFDDGQYLKTSQKRPQAFEDLNYRGEHLWTNRLSRISNIREQANQTQSSFLGPIFSWMRSFLWGDEPGSILTNSATSKQPAVSARPTDEMSQVQPLQGVPNESTPFTPSSLRADPMQEVSQSSITPQDTNKQITPSAYSSSLPEAGVQPKPTKRADSLSASRITQEFSDEMEENDNYLKEFDKQFDKGFSNFYDADPPSLIEVEDQWQEKRIKEKCYKNPIYKFLLNTEIDAFLARQPYSHWLSPEEEILLLKRRQVLGNYYDTLALTNQVSTSEALEQLVPKSYANTIYNHQFKGTLKVARRLFSIKKASAKKSQNSETVYAPHDTTFTHQPLKGGARSAKTETMSSEAHANDIKSATFSASTERVPQSGYMQDNDKKQTRVVKFDQPLFLNEKSSKNTQQILFHEELLPYGGTDEMLQVHQISPHYTNQANNSIERSNLTTPSPWNEFSKDKVNTLNQKSAPLIKNKRGEPDALTQPSKLVKSEKLYTEGVKNMGRIESAPSFLTKNVADKTIDGESLLLEQAESSPLYAGWDEQLRKFIVTNKYQNRTLAGYTFSKHPERFPNNSQAVTVFTTWPIPNPFIDNVASLTPLDQKPSLNTKNSLTAIGQVNDLVESTKSAKKSEKSAISRGRIEDATAEFLKTNTKSINHFMPPATFLFQSKPATNDMVNALLQWQKLMKENKPQETVNKQVAKEKISYWPGNIRRANWSNELVDNDMEFDEPTENVFKKKTLLWEFIPPYHGGFVWSTTNYATHSQ